MRKQILIRMNSDNALCLRDWAERKREEGSFSLNTWLVEVLEREMLKQGII